MPAAAPALYILGIPWTSADTSYPDVALLELTAADAAELLGLIAKAAALHQACPNLQRLTFSGADTLLVNLIASPDLGGLTPTECAFVDEDLSPTDDWVGCPARVQAPTVPPIAYDTCELLATPDHVLWHATLGRDELETATLSQADLHEIAAGRVPLQHSLAHRSDPEHSAVTPGATSAVPEDPPAAPFYMTLVQVEILSLGPYKPKSLDQVAYDIDQGDCRGRSSVLASMPLSASECAAALQAQGSDPSFFNLPAGTTGADPHNESDEYQPPAGAALPCSNCGTPVPPNGPFYATPCGTYCPQCITQHAGGNTECLECRGW